MVTEGSTNNNDNENDDDELATFTTSAPCQYHRGNALNVFGLRLSHDGGRLLFHPTDLELLLGTITGLVGTNGCGKSSLAKVFVQKTLDGFPKESLSADYLIYPLQMMMTMLIMSVIFRDWICYKTKLTT